MPEKTKRKIELKPVHKEHMPKILEAEAASRMRKDEDFGVMAVEATAWDFKKFQDYIRKTKDKNGLGGTTSVVALVNGNPYGIFIYETSLSGFEVNKITIHPEAPVKSIVALFVRKMKEKADNNEGKNSVNFVIKDGDYHVLEAFKEEGFSPKLHRDFFKEENCDGWICTYRSK